MNATLKKLVLKTSSKFEYRGIQNAKNKYRLEYVGPAQGVSVNGTLYANGNRLVIEEA